MQYKNLGRSGLRVSQLSYGAWVTFGNQLDVKEAKALLQTCRDAGVNFFDNAEVYANGRAEEIMGQAIRDLGWRRSDVVISTKLFWGGQGPNDKGLSRKHVVEGLRGSLRRLAMDYVDVVYCHRPDASTPVEETVRAINWVIDQGWAFYWGTSEWSAQQITEAWAVANRLDLVGPIVEQPEYNLFSRHKVRSRSLFTLFPKSRIRFARRSCCCCCCGGGATSFLSLAQYNPIGLSPRWILVLGAVHRHLRIPDGLFPAPN